MARKGYVKSAEDRSIERAESRATLLDKFGSDLPVHEQAAALANELAALASELRFSDNPKHTDHAELRFAEIRRTLSHLDATR